MSDEQVSDASKTVSKSLLIILREYGKQHPRAAGILFGGVAAFAALAVVIGFGIDVESNIPSVAYLILIGLVLYLLNALFDDVIIARTIRWFVLLLVFCWCIVFFVHRMSPKWEELACAVYFWSPCRVVADRATEEVVQPRTPELSRPSTPVPPATPQLSTSPVFMWFAGLDRNDVRSAMRALLSKGWRLQGVEAGGTRTSAAAGYAEVRYSQAEDRQTAEQLAADVRATGLIARNVRANQAPVKDGTFQIWVSP